MPRVRYTIDGQPWRDSHLAAYRIEVQGHAYRDLIRLRDDATSTTYEMTYRQADELAKQIGAMLYEVREKHRRRKERRATTTDAVPPMRNDHHRDKVRELPTLDTEACDRLSRDQEEAEPLREGLRPEVATPQRESPETPTVLH